MINLTLEIPSFGWTVHFHAAVTCYHTESIIHELREMKCPQPTLKKAYDLMRSCELNTGITYSDSSLRRSVIVVGLTADAAEFLNSLEHEVRHFVDDLVIANGYYDKEDIAYLTGELNRKLYPYVHRLLCDGCRRKEN